MAKTAERYHGTGRRKKSIARVYLTPGKGNIVINKRNIDEYFGLETLKVIVRQPLVATETADKFDVLVNVKGGGYTGQAGAIRHGIARALLTVDADYRPTLKKAGYLTRDPRMKERKKYGLKAARRAPQFSKRQDYLRIAVYGKNSRVYSRSSFYILQFIGIYQMTDLKRSGEEVV